MHDRPWSEGEDDIRREQERDARPPDPPAGDGFDLPDAWAWCPEHASYYDPEAGCPDCELGEDVRDHEGTWGPDDVVGLGPDRDDGWYLDMAHRAEFPHNPWRD